LPHPDKSVENNQTCLRVLETSCAKEITMFSMTFGCRREGVKYTERPAVYAVVRGEYGSVAVVRGAAGYIGLPGGGCLSGETPEETLVREVREELARSIRLVRRIGEATQFFYAPDEDQYYQMLGMFFLAEFPDQPNGRGEHELFWLPLTEAADAFFHESHAWAARAGLTSMPIPY
jgi:8-oxo-dGTP pyrophosphatase MutT (NUDIX family)